MRLKDVAPDIVQDIRYAGRHNFLGRPAAVYRKPVCVITREAAEALDRVQSELRQSGLGLQVFDCYHPESASEDFLLWSGQPGRRWMRIEFHPGMDKHELAAQGYVARHRDHGRGSAVDLAIVPEGDGPDAFRLDDSLPPCNTPMKFLGSRFRDGTLDFGSGYGCMDPLAHYAHPDLGTVAAGHRRMLRELMEKYGFRASYQAW
ncbi:MAG: D-alanyl-D-alanine dipeptidase [Candidatus Protistobacter heckmanni]|nr:D-alanyl-D-alanine dipeptidase [Candidatus Protistobacter heckmanni]